MLGKLLRFALSTADRVLWPATCRDKARPDASGNLNMGVGFEAPSQSPSMLEQSHLTIERLLAQRDTWMPAAAVRPAGEGGFGGQHQDALVSRLLEDRIVFIGGPIDDDVAHSVIAQMLFLQKENKNQDINLVLNTPGGLVTAGLAIYDTMEFVQCPVATYCIGQAAAMGAVLLAAGTKGKRRALPNSRIMINRPWAGLAGAEVDVSTQKEEIHRIHIMVSEILARHSGKTTEQVKKDSDRDFFMGSREAKEYGLIDEILQAPK
ncbi:MAG: ATP-dependent Clp protease proteolytic subunit [Planctomycetes bacterium]|jgi:ATP-dependent Clp protease protease subunit|nr:ATP-dependent Clp protease proteolytic subunit [Planctomycetota bacterium]